MNAGDNFYPSGCGGHKNSENACGLFPNSWAGGKSYPPRPERSVLIAPRSLLAVA